MVLKDKIINFLGDSITEGVGTSGPEYIYPNILKDVYGLKRVNNYGISGTRYAKQTKLVLDEPNTDRCFSARADAMADDADIVVVFGGVNDFAHGDALMGEFSDRTADTFYGACHALFEKLICKYPAKPIVIVTPLHCIFEECLRGNGLKERDYYPLTDYIGAIRRTAEYYSLPVCDLYAQSLIQPRIPVIKERFVPDGLHPNDAGHKVIAERLGSFLLHL